MFAHSLAQQCTVLLWPEAMGRKNFEENSEAGVGIPGIVSRTDT